MTAKNNEAFIADVSGCVIGIVNWEAFGRLFHCLFVPKMALFAKQCVKPNIFSAFLVFIEFFFLVFSRFCCFAINSFWVHSYIRNARSY